MECSIVGTYVYLCETTVKITPFFYPVCPPSQPTSQSAMEMNGFVLTLAVGLGVQDEGVSGRGTK